MMEATGRTTLPLGIACIALWHGCGEIFAGHTLQGEIADRMSALEVVGVLARLHELEEEGYQIVTWNGLGFDFPVIAQESGRLQEVQQMAMRSIDMMFHLHCVKGFPLSLKAASTGTGTAQKMDGIDGSKAVEYWESGLRDVVLSYCGQDAFATWDLARVTDQEGKLGWVSRSGRNQRLDIPDGWLPVMYAMDLELPDTSWMTAPIPREQYTAWLSWVK